jgi:hypothetical protein
VLQKVFSLRIKGADSPQKLRDFVNEVIRLTGTYIGIGNLGEELSNVIDALRL